MRELLLLRHAKAAPEPPVRGGGDFERSLSPAGRRQLGALREQMRHLIGAPDRILASPAARARETTAGLLTAFPEWRCEVVWTPALYLLQAEELRDLLRTLPDTLLRVCVVGHNPCLSELVTLLTGRMVALPTLGTAALTSPAARWADLGDTEARLLWTAVPGDAGVGSRRKKED